MEDDIDTSPGGEYYTSSNSPTSSSRNWTEDMEGGRCHLLTSALPVPFQCPRTPILLPAFPKPLPDPPVTIWALPVPRCPLGLRVTAHSDCGGCGATPNPPEHPCSSMGSVRGLSSPPGLGTGSPWVPRGGCDPHFGQGSGGAAGLLQSPPISAWALSVGPAQPPAPCPVP